jgi:hypothetical protein
VVFILTSVIKVPASEAFVEDLEELRLLLGASTTSEAVRRAIARELLLARALKGSKEIVIQGNKPDGKELHVIM